MVKAKTWGAYTVVSHEFAQKNVCIVCMKWKIGAQSITPVVEKEFKAFVCFSIDFANDNLPKAIGIPCRNTLSGITLSGMSKGKENVLPLPPAYDYAMLCRPDTRQRAAEAHQCTICNIAKESQEPKKLQGTSSNIKAKPPLLCMKCGSRYGVGLSHRCVMGDMAKNLAKSVSLEVRQRIASAAIKDSMTHLEANNVKGEVCLKTGGPKLKVYLKPKQKANRTLSVSDVDKMMAGNNLSFNQTSRVLTSVRKALGQNSVEPNAMKKKIVELSHSEDDHFCLRKLTFKDKKGVTLIKTIPIVKNLESYVHHIFSARSLDPFESKIKVGIDFGQQSLKVGMSIIQLPDKDIDHQEDIKENLNSAKSVLLLAIGYSNLVSISITLGTYIFS